MPTLSADVKLRNRVSAIDGTVILIGAGQIDRVIRFTKLPECLIPFKTKVEGKLIYPVKLNLDRGPAQEAWAQAKREAYMQARRDKPIPEALAVAAEHKDGWALDAEDVPVVEYEVETTVNPIKEKSKHK